MAQLRIIVDGKERERCELAGDVIIGRGEECAVRLDDTLVSRHHCRIEHSPDGWVAIDLKSRNGTLIENQRLERRTLKHGDVIRIGAAALQFVAESGPLLDEEVLELLSEVAPSAVLGNVEDPDETPHHEAGLAADSLTASPKESPAPESTPVPAPTPSTTQPPVEPQLATRDLRQSALARQISLWEKASVEPAPKHKKASKKKQPAKKAQTRDSHKGAPLQERLAGRLQALAGAFSSSSAQAGDDRDAPWYRRRISMPVAIVGTMVVAVVLYLVVFGLPSFGSGAFRTVHPPKQLPHANPKSND